MDATSYVDLVPSPNRNAPNFTAMIAVLAQWSVDAQADLNSFPIIFNLSVAVGDQLDKLGTWIGPTRNLNQVIDGTSVLDDASYRLLLQLFIAMNIWDGTVPGAYSVLNSIFASEGYQFLIQDNQNMTMIVTLLNPPENLLLQAVFTQGYFNLVPAGVAITIVLGAFPMISVLAGSGGGNYSQAATSYTNVDGTNLLNAIVVPTGWKLLIEAKATCLPGSSSHLYSFALNDTVGGLLDEQEVEGLASGAAPLNLIGEIVGDGASHTISLQSMTDNASFPAVLKNTSATLTPKISLVLSPST